VKFKNIIQILIFLSAGYLGSAQAISVGFSQDTKQVNLGDSVSLELIFDIDQESFGGTFQVNYDMNILDNPVFEFSSDADLTGSGIQTGLSMFESPMPGKLEVSFGTLSFSQGVLGAGVLGYLTFDTVSEGVAMLGLGDVLGGFTDFNSFSLQSVDYRGAEVAVVSSVPLPASVWLLTSAFGLLLTRKKKNYSH